jgi:hypothetical protein
MQGQVLYYQHLQTRRRVPQNKRLIERLSAPRIRTYRKGDGVTPSLSSKPALGNEEILRWIRALIFARAGLSSAG